jgi:hypothetical protein
MAEYNPEKRYTWDPKQEFVLDGGQFGLILNTLRSVLNTEESQKIQMAMQASSILEGILAKNVEDGSIKEATDTK